MKAEVTANLGRLERVGSIAVNAALLDIKHAALFRFGAYHISKIEIGSVDSDNAPGVHGGVLITVFSENRSLVEQFAIFVAERTSQPSVSVILTDVRVAEVQRVPMAA